MTQHREIVMAALWARSIRPQDRPPCNRRTDYIDPMADGQRRAGTLTKRQEFISECVPSQPGDEEILRLWGMGATLKGVAAQMKRNEANVRGRLLACHPTAVRLT